MSDQEPTSPVAIGEIEQGPSKFEQFLDRNQKTLAFTAIALVICIALFIIIKGVNENKQLAASSAYNDADDATSYQDVAKSFAGTAAGGSALLSLAEAQWDKEENDAAIDTLKNFLTEYPEHPGTPSALISLASKLSTEGNKDEAVNHLNDAIDLEDPTFSPLAKFLIAEIELEKGNHEAAVSGFEELESIGAEKLGRFYGFVNSRLLTAKSPLPAVVEPAPKADPTPQPEQKKEAPAPETKTVPQNAPAVAPTAPAAVAQPEPAPAQ